MPISKLTKRLIVALVIFLSLHAALCAQEVIPFKGEVNANNINVRSDSTINANTICALHQGDNVEVVAALYDWYKIRLPANAEAFIKKTLVAPKDNKSVTVLKNNVNIRLQPNETSVILGRAQKGETIKIIEDAGEWYRIKAPNNTFGWINKKFITPRKENK